jgi:hypothetical protein
MKLVSPKLLQGTQGYWHWCPACQQLHVLPNSWEFNGNLIKPTFSPSFRQTLDRNGKTCHYIITDGVLYYCGDCFHEQRGLVVPMPDIPQELGEWE